MFLCFFILKALRFGFEHVPDIGQIHFQIIEQNFVQRCETNMKAQACKASLCGMQPIYCVQALGNPVEFGLGRTQKLSIIFQERSRRYKE